MNNFLLGVNYWASNAGTEMWRQFDEKTIEKDLKILSENGVRDMRVFPNWRDFQPVKPNYGYAGFISEYVMESGEKPSNEYFLDEEMLSRFSLFLDLCDKYKIKVVVGLITGWMSGALFIPTALYGKNLITDPDALYFEQLFIKGFVKKFADRKTISAWDLGNECNCLSEVGHSEARCWTALISNAIRAFDNNRPIVSGMHGLNLDGSWQIKDQAAWTDVLTTHPYPYFCRHTGIDAISSLRTTLHATAESLFYSHIGKKPCMAEEVGVLGPMVSSYETAADFLRVNLFSLFANGICGMMWWCNNDQNMLKTFPYTQNMLEVQLGLIDKDYNPKAPLLEIKKFGKFLDSLSFDLPETKKDAVCLLTKGQDHWGTSYMTYILSKRAGLNLKFAFADDDIPDSDLYIMPSVLGAEVMNKGSYKKLKEKVTLGATLYLSLDDCFLEGFEELTGLRVTDSYVATESFSAEISGKKIAFSKSRNFRLSPVSAEVLSYDNSGNVFASVSNYGDGKVYVVNAPIEDRLKEKHEAFTDDTDALYKEIFKDFIEKLPLRVENENVLSTFHPSGDGAYAVLTNHSKNKVKPDLKLSGYEISDVIYGDKDEIKGFDALVLKLNAK